MTAMEYKVAENAQAAAAMDDQKPGKVHRFSGLTDTFHTTKSTTANFFRKHQVLFGFVTFVLILAMLITAIVIVYHVNRETQLAKEKSDKLADLSWKEKVLEMLEGIAKKTEQLNNQPHSMNGGRPKRVRSVRHTDTVGQWNSI